MSWVWLGGLWVCLGTYIACFIVYCLSCWDCISSLVVSGIWIVFLLLWFVWCVGVFVVVLRLEIAICCCFVYLCAAFVVIGSYRGLL